MIRMKILIIGSGGREHALAWKIRQSPLVTKFFCAPGNAGIGEIAELVPIKADDIDALFDFGNTGGMGAYAPTPTVTEDLKERS